LTCTAIATTPPWRTRTDRPRAVWDEIEDAARRAASNYRDGKAVAFESLAKCLTSDLAYTLEIERFEAKVAQDDQLTAVALRVTSIFRPEDGGWKLLHRHADPITTRQSATSVLQTWYAHAHQPARTSPDPPPSVVL
jgi:hypothetical protein